MKNLVPWLIIVIVLVAAAITGQYWIAPLLKFSGTNTDAIQGLTDLVQLILWVCGGILSLIVFLLKRAAM